MATVGSDEELVHAARGGDANALGALLARHRGRLYATALAIVREPAQAQDVVQDAFVVALRRLDDLRVAAAAGPWLTAIVRNTSLMRLRSRRDETPLVNDADHSMPSDCERAVEQLAVRDWVWAALDELPEMQRATMMLRYFSWWNSYDDIAAILGVPVGTVRSRLNQAKQRVAGALVRGADAVHSDHSRLVERRTTEWKQAIDEIMCHGTGTRYVADWAGDVLVEAPQVEYRVRGGEDLWRGFVESAEAGVRLHPGEMLVSDGVTIAEGYLENPPDDPTHCPPTQTEVRFHPDGITTRVVLYFGDTPTTTSPT